MSPKSVIQFLVYRTHPQQHFTKYATLDESICTRFITHWGRSPL